MGKSTGIKLQDYIDKHWKTPEDKERLNDLAFAVSLSHEIGRARLAKGLTQKELARRIGITQSAMSRIESPDYGLVSVTTLRRIAQALEMKVKIEFIDPSEK